MTPNDDGDPLLLAGEVATMFRVDPKTVSRWAAAGRLRSIRTAGGHRRYRKSDVLALLAGTKPTTAAGSPVTAGQVPPRVVKAAFAAKSASTALTDDGACLDALAAALTQAREEIAQQVEQVDRDTSVARLIRAWPS